MRVFQMIQSKMSPEAEPVEVQWYTGDDKARAIAAAASASIENEDSYYSVLSVTITF